MLPVVPVLHACHAVLIWFYNGSIGFTRLPILYCFQCNVCVCLDCQSLFTFKSNARHRWYIPRTVCSLCVGMIQRRWCASILPCASDLFASALGWIPFRAPHRWLSSLRQMLCNIFLDHSMRRGWKLDFRGNWIWASEPAKNYMQQGWCSTVEGTN